MQEHRYVPSDHRRSSCPHEGIMQLFLTKDANNMSTYWRLRVPRREQVVKNPPLSSTETVRHGDVTTLITTTSVTVTTTRTVTRIVTGDA